MKILVTGGNGQLGRALKKVSAKIPDHTYIFTDIEELNISSESDVASFFHSFNPDYCINCAGYTAVDNAENDKEKAFLLNADAVKILGEITGNKNCKFIHISTDYVFSGKTWQPYKETDIPDAGSVYGKSKLAGEKHLINSKHAIIIRTSWLYSEYGSNFFKTMMKLMNEKKDIKVVFDQIGTPTYAGDLASTIMTIIEKSHKNFFKYGIYHYSNEGVTSWYDFAREIGKLMNYQGIIHPVESIEFPRPAPRPFYSVLNKSRIKKKYQIKMPHWCESLEYCYHNYITQKDLRK
ncbi:MAG: dTDP-4-dehydrorhamnose reductase [Bacteroidota bacterium]